MFSHRILGVDTSELKKVLGLIRKEEIISFAGGVPDSRTFPLEKIKVNRSDAHRKLANPKRIGVMAKAIMKRIVTIPINEYVNFAFPFLSAMT